MDINIHCTIIMNELWKQFICWIFDIGSKLEFVFFIFKKTNTIKSIDTFVFLVLVEVLLVNLYVILVTST